LTEELLRPETTKLLNRRNFHDIAPDNDAFGFYATTTNNKSKNTLYAPMELSQ
jgi:hypothetical protein